MALPPHRADVDWVGSREPLEVLGILGPRRAAGRAGGELCLVLRTLALRILRRLPEIKESERGQHLSAIPYDETRKDQGVHPYWVGHRGHPNLHGGPHRVRVPTRHRELRLVADPAPLSHQEGQLEGHQITREARTPRPIKGRAEGLIPSKASTPKGGNVAGFLNSKIF